MSLVSCLAWVGRGVAAERPQRVRLDKEDLRRLVQGGTAETSDTHSDGETAAVSSGADKRLRGSARASDDELDGDDDGDTDRRYRLDDYDAEEEDAERPSALRGIACFSDAADDPYLAAGDSDSDDDDDVVIGPTDNLLLFGRVKKQEYGLEAWVFNASTNDWFAHHDYILESPALCVSALPCDPGAEDGRGNLCAVGSVEPSVAIWDVDLVDALEPACVLGDAATSPAKRKKRRAAHAHSDAVLSLAWNAGAPHVLASGSADHTVVLWDLEAAVASSSLSGHDDKVQSLEWHPVEEALLLSGSCDGRVGLWDCRSEALNCEWRAPKAAEVERVAWNVGKPFCFVVATERGTLAYADSRKPAEFVFVHRKAHKGAAAALALPAALDGCVLSGGDDGAVAVWKIGATDFDLVAKTKQPKLGAIGAVQFCPDSTKHVAVCGNKGDYIRVLDLSVYETVTDTFSLH